MAKLLRADGTSETLTPKNGKRFSIWELQAAVGGTVEVIGLTRGPHKGKVLLVDEDGRPKALPANGEATLVLHECAAFGAPRQLVGDVLLCARREAGL